MDHNENDLEKPNQRSESTSDQDEEHSWKDKVDLRNTLEEFPVDRDNEETKSANGLERKQGDTENRMSPARSVSEVFSQSNCLNETSNDQICEIKLLNSTEKHPGLAEVKHTFVELTESASEDRNNAIFDGLSVSNDRYSSSVDKALKMLKTAEDLQKQGKNVEALTICLSALKLQDLFRESNLYMTFCGNIMQLYYLMDNKDMVLNIYYDYCENALEFVSDPKVIQMIIDLYHMANPNKE